MNIWNCGRFWFWSSYLASNLIIIRKRRKKQTKSLSLCPRTSRIVNSIGCCVEVSLQKKAFIWNLTAFAPLSLIILVSLFLIFTFHPPRSSPVSGNCFWIWTDGVVFLICEKMFIHLWIWIMNWHSRFCWITHLICCCCCCWLSVYVWFFIFFIFFEIDWFGFGCLQAFKFIS